MTQRTDGRFEPSHEHGHPYDRAVTTTQTTPLYLDSEVHQRRWRILGSLCLSLLIVFVANSSLNVAIPTLARGYHASSSDLQWVIASYSLVFAGLLFTTGALGDRFGRKGLLQAGLVGFLVCSVLASMSHHMWQFIACRALMGIAAAMIMPSTLSILVNVFSPQERAKAIAMWAAVTGGAGAIGPVASGWLLGHFWVGAVFLVNVPFVLIALATGAAIVPKSRDPEHSVLDIPGAALSTIGLASLVYALIQGPELGWRSAQVLVAAAIAVAALVAFAQWERRTPHPMLDPHLFSNRAFTTSAGGMVLVFLAMYGVMFLITQYLQIVLDYSPLDASLRLLPMTPIMIVVAPLTPRIVARHGVNRTVALGLAGVTFGLLLFRTLEADSSYGHLLFCVFFVTSGIALTMSPMTAALMSAVPADRAGAGSAMNDTTRELGAAMGIAVLGSVAAATYAHGVDRIEGVPAPALRAARASVGQAKYVAAQVSNALGPKIGARLLQGAYQAFMDALHLAVTFGAVLTGVAAVLMLRFLPHQTPVAEAQPQ